MKEVSLAQCQAQNRCLVNVERKEGGLCHSGVWNLPITPKLKSWSLTLVHEALHVLPPNHSSIVLPLSFSSVSMLSMFLYQDLYMSLPLLITISLQLCKQLHLSLPSGLWSGISSSETPSLPCLGESTHNPYSVTIYFLYFWFFFIAHIAAWYWILCLFVNILSSPLCYKLSHWGSGLHSVYCPVSSVFT